MTLLKSKRQISQKINHIHLRIKRTTILFTTGLLGVVHETLLAHGERPTLLILFAAMMGLPAFLGAGTPGNYDFDSSKEQKEEKEEQQKEREKEREREEN